MMLQIPNMPTYRATLNKIVPSHIRRSTTDVYWGACVADRGARTFVDNDFDGRDVPLLLRVVPVTDANQPVAIPGAQFFGAGLPWQQGPFQLGCVPILGHFWAKNP